MTFFWTSMAAKRHNALMILSSMFACALYAPLPACAGTVSAVEISDSEVRIRFDDVVEAASAFTLSGPDRVALDIRGATAGQGGAPAGLVRNVRQGQFDPQTARIVLDLQQPAMITKGSFGADGRSLTLSLSPLTGGAASNARKDFLPPLGFRADPPKATYSVKVPLGRPKDSRNLPKIYGPADPSRPLIVIDAGHGGHDPGAISPHNNKREKDVTLAIARAIRDRLVRGGRVRVALTRDSDMFLVLEERYGIARRMKADLFVSIHADSAGNEEASGATVYTLSEVASDREAARLAARENKANIINGINLGGAAPDVSSILIDLTQRETMNISADFAKLLTREGEGKLPFRQTPHRFASFVVLKAPDTPSILFETGYISNQRDGDFLSSTSGQRSVADAVGSAVEIHFARKLAGR